MAAQSEAAKRLIAEALAAHGGESPKTNDAKRPSTSRRSSKQRTVKFSHNQIAEQIVCHLCAGYIVSATTISECLHTFCKSCIVKHFRTTRHCPVCNLLVHETNPLETLRADRSLGALIYKIVPHVKIAEDEARRAFLGLPDVEETSDTLPDAQPPAKRVTIDPRDQIALLLQRAESRVVKDVKDAKDAKDDKDDKDDNDDNDVEDDPPLEALSLPYIRTSSQATIHHLKKLLALKLNNIDPDDVDILCQGEVLGRELNLEYVAKTRWRGVDTHLVLQYRPRVVAGLV
eukprot:m.46169 g.46169  ORF g.46169 m.46169 type:complete len:288 (-) comp13122_c0_seq4:808-1671(-)